MHSEYGLQARTESIDKTFVKGLKTLFPDKIVIFSLDPISTRRRGLNPDVELIFSYDAVHVDDILSLQNELALHATAVEAAYLIAAQYKKQWLSVLLTQGACLKEFAQSLGAHPESIAALYRKLKRIEQFPFFTAEAVGNISMIDQIIECFDRNISVIIEFGNYTSSFIYLLIANMITRRIHAAYIAKTEHFLGTQKKEDEPKKLMICIEEAHKFLNPQAAQQTIFGTIAREMRKYYVSLLIVDQRPSGIDQEILSQIGTKIIAQLHDEKDIQATLTGMSNANSLRTVLATLDSKKQALVIGHAITMPVVIQTREYDEQFYEQMAPAVSSVTIDTFIKELF
jgi:DNA helicase HerA-like ATPase